MKRFNSFPFPAVNREHMENPLLRALGHDFPSETLLKADVHRYLLAPWMCHDLELYWFLAAGTTLTAMGQKEQARRALEEALRAAQAIPDKMARDMNVKKISNRLQYVVGVSEVAENSEKKSEKSAAEADSSAGRCASLRHTTCVLPRNMALG